MHKPEWPLRRWMHEHSRKDKSCGSQVVMSQNGQWMRREESGTMTASPPTSICLLGLPLPPAATLTGPTPNLCTFRTQEMENDFRLCKKAQHTIRNPVQLKLSIAQGAVAHYPRPFRPRVGMKWCALSGNKASTWFHVFKWMLTYMQRRLMHCGITREWSYRFWWSRRKLVLQQNMGLGRWSTRWQRPVRTQVLRYWGRSIIFFECFSTENSFTTSEGRRLAYNLLCLC